MRRAFGIACAVTLGGAVLVLAAIAEGARRLCQRPADDVDWSDWPDETCGCSYLARALEAQKES